MAPYGKPPEDHGYVPIDLLEQIPSLMLLIIKTRYFPSMKVLNDLFSKGEFDSGMSGGVSWEVFSIIKSDWQALKLAISVKYKITYEVLDECKLLETYDEWAERKLSIITKN